MANFWTCLIFFNPDFIYIKCEESDLLLILNLFFPVFDQKENYNFDQFTKTLSSSPRNLRPAKSKSLAKGKKDWQSLSLAQQYEILHHVANEHTRVTLNFEALGLALKSSLASNSLKAAFSLQKGHSGLRMNTNLSKQRRWCFCIKLVKSKDWRY